ncbi:WD repeat-containing protein 92 [Thecamonas trahens ATCC 50062]|uniref:WD repeat-containing protein 92 n=1 Tax=Thecamonas trahens ATCC 50062 TaxID=461836 RepID=A0A0L0DET3_THETB|nr:WD repeat-containing protein 92 [Thecamonas trahens ATCC 50062]KNC49833.1 WD repeat-containing protein 92 [Thecamonas trahens ATCC 50062]|eukprot:XP_013757327.1 WD repeat-containing protein 92 [Thecamonas trahens ATCC 50062]
MAAASDTPQILTHIAHSVTYTVFDTKWVPRSARAVGVGQTARGRGIIQVYSLGKKGTLQVEAETGKAAGFKCATFAASALEDRFLATGDFSGRLAVWDLDHPELPVYAASAHDGIVNAIDGIGGVLGAGAPEIVTGGRDGVAKVWDTRQKNEPVLALKPAAGSDTRDCWAVAFGNAYSDEERTVVTGYDNGDVKMFDLRMSKLVWETNVANGVCHLAFDRPDIEMNKLYVSTLESKLRVYDMRTFSEDLGYAHVTHADSDCTVWRSAPLPQDRDVFMAAYGNGSLSLCKYKYPDKRSETDAQGKPVGVAGSVIPLASASISTQPIHCFDWSADKRGLCVFGSFDQCIRVGIVTRLEVV